MTTIRRRRCCPSRVYATGISVCITLCKQLKRLQVWEHKARTPVCKIAVSLHVNFTRLLSAQYDAGLKLSCAPWSLTGKPFQSIFIQPQTLAYTFSLQAIASLWCVAPFLSDFTCYGMQFSLSFSGPGIST